MSLVHGETDSERFFALITREARRTGDVGEGIAAAARWVAENLPLFAINLVLISAQELWALRYPDSHDLLVLERDAGGAGGDRHLEHSSPRGRIRVHSGDLADQPAVVVATEKMDEDPGWSPLASGELLHVDADLRVTRTRVLDAPPAHPLTLADLGAQRRRLAVAADALIATSRAGGARVTRSGDGDPAPPRLPPGPVVPALAADAGFMLGGVRYLDWCRRRYGDIVTMGTLFDQRFVMLFDPGAVKELFQGSGDSLHAGEANALLGPIVGERSVLLLDGAEHLRHRRLLLPPFHGQRMLAHVETMRACADTEIDRWPVGEPFTLLESMQSLTLRVILRAVFGYDPRRRARTSSRGGCGRWWSRCRAPAGVMRAQRRHARAQRARLRPAVRGAQARRGRDRLRRDRAAAAPTPDLDRAR